MEKKKIFATLSLILMGVVFGVILATGFNWVKPGYGLSQIGSPNPLVNVNQDVQKLNEAFIKVAEAVTPTVVYIETKTSADIVDMPEHEFFKDFPFFKDLPKQPQVGTGSGVIISSDGYIVTNNHVVNDAKSISVILNDKRKFTAELVGTDPLTDLAVIKIDAKNLTPAYLGNSDDVKVGQWVLAIGNPLGLTSTVTAGIVSAIGRGGLRLIQDSYGIEDFIQTDAAINPGNSGGALVDLNGAVIGINTAIASRTGYYQGYGFAIPVNIVKTVAKDLIDFGKVKRGYIGVQIREVDNATAKALGLEKTQGVIVESLVEGGAAKDAGIEEGDVILSIDGKEVYKPNDLQSYVASKHAGDKVKLKIFRNGKTFEKEITLRPRKEDEADAKPVKKK
ncbi:MAG: S1C family serine protease, partial [Ignavibacteria bacterium]